MNRIEIIIQKFDINPCTLSAMEAREYLYYLYEQSKPFKNRKLADDEQRQYDEVLERLKITEIFYDALMHLDTCPWLDFNKLLYRLENTPQTLDANELTVFQYYLQKRLKAENPEAGLEKLLVQVRTMLKTNRA